MNVKDVLADLPTLVTVGVFLPWIINLLQGIKRELELIEEYLRPKRARGDEDF